MKITGDYAGISLLLEVEDGTDLDSTFTGTCLDTGEKLKVNGWLAVWEPYEPEEEEE